MASGDTLAVFTPQMNEPPASNYATLDLRNLHPVLDYDDTTNETGICSNKMPQNYDGGGVTVYIVFSMTSATADTVDWDVAFERIGVVLDIDADSFAAVNSVDNTTVSGTCGIPVSANVAFTNGAEMDEVVAGDDYRIKVIRDAASDDATGDAELISVEIRET